MCNNISSLISQAPPFCVWKKATWYVKSNSRLSQQQIHECPEKKIMALGDFLTETHKGKWLFLLPGSWEWWIVLVDRRIHNLVMTVIIDSIAWFHFIQHVKCYFHNSIASPNLARLQIFFKFWNVKSCSKPFLHTLLVQCSAKFVHVSATKIKSSLVVGR